MFAAFPAPRVDLWAFYATGGFLRRNQAFALELATVANEGVSLRRVFEFASDGSFMTIHALERAELRSAVKHWVTSDVSANALRHSTWLFHCGAPCVEHPLRPLRVPPHWESTRGTYMLRKNQTRVDVESVDVSHLHRSVHMDAFDAFVTISFEHILKDIQLIRTIPCGKWFIFSVPNFGAPPNAKKLAKSCQNASYIHACDQHWHVFRNEAEIRARYGGVLNIRRIRRVPHIGEWVKFIVSGQRTCASRNADDQLHFDEPPRHQQSFTSAGITTTSINAVKDYPMINVWLSMLASGAMFAAGYNMASRR